MARYKRAYPGPPPIHQTRAAAPAAAQTATLTGAGVCTASGVVPATAAVTGAGSVTAGGVSPGTAALTAAGAVTAAGTSSGGPQPQAQPFISPVVGLRRTSRAWAGRKLNADGYHPASPPPPPNGLAPARPVTVRSMRIARARIGPSGAPAAGNPVFATALTITGTVTTVDPHGATTTWAITGTSTQSGASAVWNITGTIIS